MSGKGFGQEAVAATTSEDWLLGGRVRLRQPKTGYRTAIDAVFLAAALAPDRQARVLDLGCGVGAAALCLAARFASLQLTGMDLQPELVRLAAENARANAVADRVFALCGDLRAMPFAPASFDCVVFNPAFHPAGRSRAPRDPARALALFEGDTPLAAWFGAALKALRPRGRLATVLRADRLDDALAALQGAAGDLHLYPLWPKAGQPAKRVVITGRKGLKTALTLHPGLVVHQDDGRYTPAAEAILRHGAGLGE